jgi:putative copper export protein/mono/diheme cytochrome c family protein
MGPEAIILALLRGFHLVALASLFGTLVSLALVAPAGLREAGAAAAAPARARLVALARWSDVLAVVLGIGWMLLATATIAGADSVGGTFGALGTVLSDTRFGQLILLRLLLLLLALVFLGGRGWPLAAGLLLSGAALGMQGFMGHAGATGGSVGDMLLASEAVHLLAAGAWLGGLLPLFVLAGALPPPAAATACEHFTPVGLSAVVAIAGTAIVQAWQLIGGLAGLFGTAYGHVALLKLAIFFVLLMLAGINRLVLTNRLRDPNRPVTRALLQGSIGAEAILGAGVIVVAAFLASGTPALHETPVWPFSRRPSLDLLADPNVRHLILRTLVPSLAAIALVAAGWFFWRPLFWGALAGLAVCLVLAWPDLEPLLTIDAYPTTFAVSPTEFAVGSIMRGAALFTANCATCHGAEARGDGPAARSLPIQPADLTAPHFWMHTEGDLYWFIAHGIEVQPGVPAMPPFGDALSSGKMWSLIDFLKANNAGAGMRATGRWDHPTQLPQFDAICADGSAINRDDLSNKVVHIIAADRTVMPPPAPPGIPVATIVLAHDKSVKPAGSACVTVEPDAWNAFALLLGEKPDALTGTQVLADANGWLRLRWRPGDPGAWNSTPALDVAIRDIAAHPLAVTAGGGHGHHH